MKKIGKKLKRVKPIIRYIYYLMILTFLVSFLYFAKNILALKDIENNLRIIILCFFLIYYLYYIIKNLCVLVQKKYSKFITSSLICLVFIGLFYLSNYFLSPINNLVANIQEKEKLNYTTYLIMLNETNFTDKSVIGRISDKDDIEGYVLAEKLYKKEKLTNNIKDYDDYVLMLKELKSQKIDALFVPSNYVKTYEGEEGLEDLGHITKIIKTYNEEMANQEKVEISNKDFNDPLTFLIMGVDSEKNGLKENAAFNGDTLMLVAFNPHTLRTTLVSFPRDTYVPIACKNNNYAKINSAAAKGTNCVIETVSNLLDIKIDYYAKINFKGVVDLVDAVDGINVEVEKPDYNYHNNLNINCNGKFCEQNSDRKAGKNIIYIDPGWQTLNGEEALAYSRSRYLYAGGDIDRIKHQQQVIEALASKILSFDSIADFQKILNAVNNNLVTNMDRDKILSGYEVLKKIMSNAFKGDDLLSIDKAFLETYNLRVYVESSKSYTSAQGYYEDSLEDIKKSLKETLELAKEKNQTTFAFSANEEYHIPVPGANKKEIPHSSVLPSFISKTVKEAENYCQKEGIKCSIKYVDPESEYYNESVGVGLIGKQSPHENVLINNVDNLTLYVVNSAIKDKNKEESKTKEDNEEIDTNIQNFIR